MRALDALMISTVMLLATSRALASPNARLVSADAQLDYQRGGVIEVSIQVTAQASPGLRSFQFGTLDNEASLVRGEVHSRTMGSLEWRPVTSVLVGGGIEGWTLTIPQDRGNPRRDGDQESVEFKFSISYRMPAEVIVRADGATEWAMPPWAQNLDAASITINAAGVVGESNAEHIQMTSAPGSVRYERDHLPRTMAFSVRYRVPSIGAPGQSFSIIRGQNYDEGRDHVVTAMLAFLTVLVAVFLGWRWAVLFLLPATLGPFLPVLAVALCLALTLIHLLAPAKVRRVQKKRDLNLSRSPRATQGVSSASLWAIHLVAVLAIALLAKRLDVTLVSLCAAILAMSSLGTGLARAVDARALLPPLISELCASGWRVSWGDVGQKEQCLVIQHENHPSELLFICATSSRLFVWGTVSEGASLRKRLDSSWRVCANQNKQLTLGRFVSAKPSELVWVLRPWVERDPPTPMTRESTAVRHVA